MTEHGELTPFGEAFKEIAESRGMTLEEAMASTVAEAEAASHGDEVWEEMSWLVYMSELKQRAREDAAAE